MKQRLIDSQIFSGSNFYIKQSIAKKERKRIYWQWTVKRSLGFEDSIRFDSIWFELNWIEEEKMGILYDDVVIMRQSEKEGEATVITVNCPDKTGLGCDLCRLILLFGLTILRVGILSLRLRISTVYLPSLTLSHWYLVFFFVLFVPSMYCLSLSHWKISTVFFHLSN